MNNLKKNLLLATVLLMAAVSGYALQTYQWAAEEEQAQRQASAKIIMRPEFSVTDIHGQLRDIKEWDGKVILLNFWATWCPPCRREMPAFIRLQEKYKDQGFTIIGIALDEKQAVIDFTDPMGMNYPILMAELEGIAISKAYGNSLGVLPFTVIIDRKGNIIHRQRTELTFEQVEGMIKPLL